MNHYIGKTFIYISMYLNNDNHISAVRFSVIKLTGHENNFKITNK